MPEVIERCHPNETAYDFFGGRYRDDLSIA